MRRRLMFALVGLALAAIVLVGVGMVVLAQFGAQRSAASQVESQLVALAEIADDAGSIERFRGPLGRLGEAFDLNDALLVDLASDGARPINSPGTQPLLELTTEQYEQLERGETLVVDRPGRVIGLVALDGGTDRGPFRGRTLGLLIEQPVTPFPAEARAWFLLSAALVLVLAFGVAAWLSDRFTQPLREIEAATARLADGHLDTRVDIRRDDEFGQLGAAMNVMAADLEHNRAAEQEFLMSISHDLRTPLTVIQGYGEALEEGATPDPARTGAIITSHAQRLSRLVGDLLDLARFASSDFALDPSPCDTVPIARRCVEGLAPTAERQGLRTMLETETEQAVAQADPDRLAQVLANLVENAIKYAESTITVAVSEPSSESVELTVADDGPGIPAQDVPHVFERLYVTSQRPQREENSSGLGLAIVRELVSAMGGEVSAELPPTGGTLMRVRLPAASAEQRAVSAVRRGGRLD